jgi:hypothetical protein
MAISQLFTFVANVYIGTIICVWRELYLLEMGRLVGIFYSPRLIGSSRLMSNVTGLDRKGTPDAIFPFAIASDMCSGVGHIIKYITP